ncbi:hypothetical protein [Paenibacillus xanthanilyticus]|uniref:Uncharacterized protein n=1 Tax=Paenibacillus xanthanilyticus TaxID=1783531 RepID=A0ABV8JY96_9BACL
MKSEMSKSDKWLLYGSIGAGVLLVVAGAVLYLLISSNVIRLN